MPLYEYRCHGCEHTFETYVRAWGEGVACPRCRSAEVEKLLSSFALTGSGGAVSSSPPGGCGCGRGGCGCGR